MSGILEISEDWKNKNRELYRRCDTCNEPMFGIPADIKPAEEIRKVCHPCGGKHIEDR